MIFCLICSFVLSAYAQDVELPPFMDGRASENVLVFEHVYGSSFASLEEIERLSSQARQNFVVEELLPLMRYLAGPGVYRAIGIPQGNDAISVRWSRAYVERGRVMLPYRYIGSWYLGVDVVARKTVSLPIPRSEVLLLTPNWRACTQRESQIDSAPAMMWRSWDPARPGCDQVEGVHYDTIHLRIGTAVSKDRVRTGGRNEF